MTINPIHTNASSLDLTQLLGSRNAQSQNSGLSSTQTSDEISVQNPDMAKVFQFMEQMQQLQTSDPGKFKSVMSELPQARRFRAVWWFRRVYSEDVELRLNEDHQCV